MDKRPGYGEDQQGIDLQSQDSNFGHFEHVGPSACQSAIYSNPPPPYSYPSSTASSVVGINTGNNGYGPSACQSVYGQASRTNRTVKTAILRLLVGHFGENWCSLILEVSYTSKKVENESILKCAEFSISNSVLTRHSNSLPSLNYLDMEKINKESTYSHKIPISASSSTSDPPCQPVYLFQPTTAVFLPVLYSQLGGRDKYWQ